jgi:hypothetical protein
MESGNPADCKAESYSGSAPTGRSASVVAIVAGFV